MTQEEKDKFLTDAAYEVVDADRNYWKAEPEMKTNKKKEFKAKMAILRRAVDTHKQSKVQP